MINEEVKVIECSVDDFEQHLNTLCELAWDLMDWKIDFSSRQILAIFVRNLSVESCGWIDRLDKTIDRLAELRGDEEDEDTL